MTSTARQLSNADTSVLVLMFGCDINANEAITRYDPDKKSPAQPHAQRLADAALIDVLLDVLLDASIKVFINIFIRKWFHRNQ